MMIDRNTTLCLSCSSSLPPSYEKSNSIHITSCCQRPICPSCITANPRLARYNPCLACLGGVGVVASNATPDARSPALNANLNSNIDGAVRDEDTFVLGDDDSDDDDDDDDDEIVKEQDSETHVSRSVPLPPPYNLESSVPPLDSRSRVDTEENPLPSHIKSDLEGSPKDTSEHSVSSSSFADNFQTRRTAPYKYYINRNDTLQGIALGFGLDVHEICELNNLPFHSIRTMPNLLHTRVFLLLPPSTKSHHLLKQDGEDDERKTDIVRKHAEKRLQMLTKEVDWRVAKAYVALAEDDHEEMYERKGKEQDQISGMRSGAGILKASRLEMCAIDSYLDDEEWEQAERQAGRGAFLSQFPILGARDQVG